MIRYLKNLDSNELIKDDFDNLRYIGADPNNYVLFNNELWRIIGVMKDIENADGSKEDKVKLIRSESIGKFGWDNKESGIGSSTRGHGSNDWSDSQLMMMLNPNNRIKKGYSIDNDGYIIDSKGYKIYRNMGSYYNRTTGYKPAEATTTSFKETEIDFSNIGLTNESKNMISESVWNLGMTNIYKNVTPKIFYEFERGTIVSSGRPTKWTGEVGLIYPSDYGYATSGGATTDRGTCLDTEMYNWHNNSVSDCKNNDWLKKNEEIKWTLTSYSVYSNLMFQANYAEFVQYNQVNTIGAVLPVVYLKPNITIENNNIGSSTSPFILKID